jgi:hypothetical protein
MRSSTLRDVVASPLGVPLDLLTEQATGSAIIEISHCITSDIPDGRPSPPPDRDVLWVVVRRANGCTLWRAIHLVISRFPVIAATTEKTKVHPVVDRVRGRVVRAAGILGPPTPPDSIHRIWGRVRVPECGRPLRRT